MKTQAVSARTYALSYMNRELIDDTIMYQVYGGYIWTPDTTKAVDETRGQVIQYNGRLIDAVYSASNGGITECNANAWDSASVPYLTEKEDIFDPKSVWNFSFHKNQINVSQLNLSKQTEWWTTVKEADTTVSNNIKMWLDVNDYANKEIKVIAIPEFKLHSPGSGGRMSKRNITVEFFVKDILDVNGNLAVQRVVLQNVNISKIRAMLGTRVMLSYLVDKVDTDDRLVKVSGRGDGHGVGMSQWGAKYRADAGKKYEEILKFYYNGISIVTMYDESESIVSSANGTVPVKQTGWVLENGKWYFLQANGAMATGWLKDKNKWYYLTSSGAMATGWIKDKNKCYYLSTSGAMVMNRQYINGRWHLFHSRGNWLGYI
ncbi:SpoIID/LytB domain-containing protein [Neobacillus thermocopriae]|uniref:SpoIID/LytB domain-containing protein n=1 Tax=Neobacillus thermocopriae TaxID=1215031 RepID=UPI00376FE3FE